MIEKNEKLSESSCSEVTEEFLRLIVIKNIGLRIYLQAKRLWRVFIGITKLIGKNFHPVIITITSSNF